MSDFIRKNSGDINVLNRNQKCKVAANTTVVYTMGKVASTSVASGLREAGQVVFDMHTLNDRYILGKISEITEKCVEKIPRNYIDSLYVHKNIDFLKKNATFVSVAREPLSRNISAFFQNRNLSDHVEKGNDFSVVKNFIDNYPHELPINFFDEQFKKYLGFDVYKKKFNNETLTTAANGYIVIRFDARTEIMEGSLSDFFSKRVILKKMNVTLDKPTANIYLKVKERLKKEFPLDLKDVLFRSKYMTYFFTPNEIDEIYSYWS